MQLRPALLLLLGLLLWLDAPYASVPLSVVVAAALAPRRVAGSESLLPSDGEELGASPYERHRRRGGAMPSLPLAGPQRADWQRDADTLMRMGLDWAAAKTRQAARRAAEEDDAAFEREDGTRAARRPGGGRDQIDEQQEDDEDAVGGMLELLATQVVAAGSAVWAPVDWAIHWALRAEQAPSVGGAEGHPLDGAFDVARTMLGFGRSGISSSSSASMQPEDTDERSSTHETQSFAVDAGWDSSLPSSRPSSDGAATGTSDVTAASTAASVSGGVLAPTAAVSTVSSLYCSTLGLALNASRTLRTCNTSADDASLAQSAADYDAFLSGSLLLAFAAEPDVVLDPSLSADTSCTDVSTYFTSESGAGHTWFQETVASAPGYAGADEAEREDMLYAACASLSGNATAAARNTSLVQWCQLETRCYARARWCHSWIEETSFCACPYDLVGDVCETKRTFQCDVRMVYPPMDVQRVLEPAAGGQDKYSCPLPSGFRSRLPSTWDNPGTSSAALVRPLTELQRRLGWVPFLDGDEPCLEFPTTTGNTGVPNAAAVAQASGDGALDILFSLVCKFMSDQDPNGTNTSYPSPAGQGLTYSQVVQGPSAATVAWLTAGGFEWDKDYASLPFRYDVLRRTPSGDVEYAVSRVEDDAMRVRLHPYNSARPSDTSADVLSDAASALVLQSPPSDALVDAAGRMHKEQGIALLRNFTLVLTVPLTRLSPATRRGGRWLLDAMIDTGESARSYQGPRGLDRPSARYPARIRVEDSSYRAPDAYIQKRFGMLLTAFLVVLVLAAVALAWRAYKKHQEAEFQRVVRRAKAKSAKQAREAQQRRDERSQLRAQTASAIGAAPTDPSSVELEEM